LNESLPSLVAMGDPQAPFSRVLAVLGHHGLLDQRRRGRPRLRTAARLLSIGDHFDWGSNDPDERVRAAADGEACLRFLASHPAEQVVMLAGNHDLARVGELLGVDDETFTGLQAAADRHYYGGGALADEDRFFRLCSFLPSTEMVARDLSTYRASQQQLVLSLLRKRRLRLAWAENGLLFTHAGVTRRAMWRLGLTEDSDPAIIADTLNGALDRAVDSCLKGSRRRPLHIPAIYRPGDAIGEGDGILFHRPTFVDDEQWLEPRRFDPRKLPRGLWQVVGHVRDKRCVEALGPWSVPKAHENGVIRHLTVIDGEVTYRHGPPPPRDSLPPRAAVMIFIDGAMGATEPAAYHLLDSRACRSHVAPGAA
jgi:hypothetical protein